MIILRKEPPSQSSHCEVQRARRCGGGREVVFWLLLLGSWEFLAVPVAGSGIIGAVGTVVFLLFAVAHLDRLEALGLKHARWRSVTGHTLVLALTSGLTAGLLVFWIATASGEVVHLNADRRLFLLQTTLGPVLEEIVFRGYLFAVVLWGVSRVLGTRWHWCAVAISAAAFTVAHLAQPGIGWVQAACITSTGALYGFVRYTSGSVTPAVVSHAAYNLTLYAVSSALKLLGGRY